MQPFLRFITSAQSARNNAAVPSAHGYVTGWRNVLTLSVHNQLPADIHVRSPFFTPSSEQLLAYTLQPLSCSM